MASSSPSEFLTFYRRIVINPTIRRTLTSSGRSPWASYVVHRRYASSGKTNSTDRPIAMDRPGSHDVQSDPSQRAMKDKSKGEGGQATTQRDERDNTQRAKKEHPEAPDVIIGMQDERGAKGH